MISTCYLPPDFSSTCSTQNLLITFVVKAALYNTTVKLIKYCLKCETVREMRDCCGCGRVSEVREGEESACGARGMRSGRYRCEGRRDTPGTFQWHSCANMYSRQPQPGRAPQPERIVAVVVGRGHIPAARSLKVTPRVAQSGPRHGGARDHAMSRLPGLRLPLPPVPVPVPGLRLLLHLPHRKSPRRRAITRLG